MRCKKHLSDYSSGLGVCASCLRERLHILIQTQSNHHTQLVLVRPHLEDDQPRKSDSIQPQIVFPRSVSPYVTRRKSDNTPEPHLQRFYSTPQIGPNGVIVTENTSDLYTRRRGKFSILAKLFRSKTQKLDSDLNYDVNPRYSVSAASATATATATVSETSSSWFSSLFANKSKKKMLSKSFPAFGDRRGMSPTAESDEECGERYSDYSSEETPGWKETPVRATPQGKRRQNHRNVAGMAFCLSPLVRPSPNRSWTQKGVTPEGAIPSGEVRVPGKPHLSDAASFRGNRSRKLANFGRLNPKY